MLLSVNLLLILGFYFLKHKIILFDYLSAFVSYNQITSYIKNKLRDLTINFIISSPDSTPPHPPPPGSGGHNRHNIREQNMLYRKTLLLSVATFSHQTLSLCTCWRKKLRTACLQTTSQVQTESDECNINNISLTIR